MQYNKYIIYMILKLALECASVHRRPPPHHPTAITSKIRTVFHIECVFYKRNEFVSHNTQRPRCCLHRTHWHEHHHI